MTRSGLINAYATDATACSPSSSPRFHHDNANSGDYRRDAVLPGVPADASVEDGELDFIAPGDDLLCGTAAGYEIATSAHLITPANFDRAELLDEAPVPAGAGSDQSFTLPNTKRYVAVRAVDDQGNVGRPATVDLGPPGGGGGGAGGGGSGGDDGIGAGDAGAGDTGAAGTGDDGSGAGDDGTGTGDGSGGDGSAGGPEACANPIDGTAGKDRLRGTDGPDRIRGLDGDDRIDSLGGDDCVSGQGGEDRLLGGSGDDVIRARGGSADRVDCGPGDDTVYLDNRRDRARNCETINP